MELRVIIMLLDVTSHNSEHDFHHIPIGTGHLARRLLTCRRSNEYCQKYHSGKLCPGSHYSPSGFGLEKCVTPVKGFEVSLLRFQKPLCYSQLLDLEAAARTVMNSAF